MTNEEKLNYLERASDTLASELMIRYVRDAEEGATWVHDDDLFMRMEQQVRDVFVRGFFAGTLTLAKMMQDEANNDGGDGYEY